MPKQTDTITIDRTLATKLAYCAAVVNDQASIDQLIVEQVIALTGFDLKKYLDCIAALPMAKDHGLKKPVLFMAKTGALITDDFLDYFGQTFGPDQDPDSETVEDIKTVQEILQQWGMQQNSWREILRNPDAVKVITTFKRYGMDLDQAAFETAMRRSQPRDSSRRL